MIQVHLKTRCPETLNLANKIRSFLFEQECGELRYFTDPQKKHLETALKALTRVYQKYKQ